MAITFRNSATVQPGGATTAVVNKPTGVVSGDVMYACVFDQTSAQAITLTGWTELAHYDSTFDRLTVLRKVAGGSEPTSYTFTGGGTSSIADASISAYVGVNNATPEDVTTPAGTTGSTSPASSPTLTTVTDNAWHVAMYQSTGDATALSLPTGYTNDVATFGSAGVLLRVDHKQISPAGSVAAANSTVTAPTAPNWDALSVALRPAAGGAVAVADPVGFASTGNHFGGGFA